MAPTENRYRRKSDMIESLTRLKVFSVEEQSLIIKKAAVLMEQNKRMEASAAIIQAIELSKDRRLKVQNGAEQDLRTMRGKQSPTQRTAQEELDNRAGRLQTQEDGNGQAA